MSFIIFAKSEQEEIETEIVKQKLKEIKRQRYIVFKALWCTRLLEYGSVCLILFSIFCMIHFGFDVVNKDYIALSYFDVIKNATKKILFAVSLVLYFVLMIHLGDLFAKEHGLLRYKEDYWEILEELKEAEKFYKSLLKNAKKAK